MLDMTIFCLKLWFYLLHFVLKAADSVSILFLLDVRFEGISVYLGTKRYFEICQIFSCCQTVVFSGFNFFFLKVNKLLKSIHFFEMSLRQILYFLITIQVIGIARYIYRKPAIEPKFS